jgi:hypothetical protein
MRIVVSHLQSLPSSSIIRETYFSIYIQEKVSPCILGCIFQNIPVRKMLHLVGRKWMLKYPVKASLIEVDV